MDLAAMQENAEAMQKEEADEKAASMQRGTEAEGEAAMVIECVWEHNGNDTLLYAANLPGAYTRGPGKEPAMEKMVQEARAFLRWKGEAAPADITVEIVQEAACELHVSDADSDVLFDSEKAPLS